MLKYQYQETPEIRKLLIELEALKIIFQNLKIMPALEENLRRESILKSSVFSARVEGNPLTLEKVKNLPQTSGGDITKIEVFNLLSVYRYLNSGKTPKKLSLNFIFRLHCMVMKNLSSRAGKFRKEPWAIFNAAGIVVYLAPPFSQVPQLMTELVKLNFQLKEPVGVCAGIVGFLFEKIHPFADGNGRTGRVVSAYILKTGGYDFRGLSPFEEYIDARRSEYYRVLEQEKDGTDYVQFFLEALVDQSKEIVSRLSQPVEKISEAILLPRRQEILAIIRNHSYCSFDFLLRRFPAVNPKTLHYDLQRLQKQGLVEKVGRTRGASYKARKS